MVQNFIRKKGEDPSQHFDERTDSSTNNDKKEKWEYAIITFKKGVSKATIVHGKGVVENHEPEFIQTNSFDERYNATKINFLTKLGMSGWEIIDIIDDNQMFLKRKA